MRRATCLILLVAGLASPGRAAEKEPVVNARFRALAFDGPIADAAYAVSEDERVPLLISSDLFTAEQRYHGPARIRFSHLSAKDLTEAPLAEAQLAERDRVILLFVPDGRGGQAIRVLRDNPEDFPWGSLRFINLTGARVQLVSGGRTLTVAAGGDRVMRPSAAHGQYASTEILTERDDGFSRGYMLRTFQEDNLRTLYFLLPSDPHEHAILIKGVEERMLDEKAAPIPQATPISLRPKAAKGGPAPKVSGTAKGATR